MKSVFGLLVAAAVLLSGCAGSRLAKPAENKNHAGRITSARVVWVEPHDFRYSIHKGAAGYGYTPPKPVINDLEKGQANVRVRTVLETYKTRAPETLAKALATEGVGVGEGTKIYVRPLSASIDAHSGSLHMEVEVSVLHTDVVSPWKITTITNNMLDASYWNVLRKPGVGDVPDVDLNKLVDSFSGSVVHEMKMAGWFR